MVLEHHAALGAGPNTALPFTLQTPLDASFNPATRSSKRARLAAARRTDDNSKLLVRDLHMVIAERHDLAAAPSSCSQASHFSIEAPDGDDSLSAALAQGRSVNLNI